MVNDDNSEIINDSLDYSSEYIESDLEGFTEGEIDVIKNMSGSAKEQSLNKSTSHFTDRILQRLVKRPINDNNTEETKGINEPRGTQPKRKLSEGLSVRILMGNFKKLSSKMTPFFSVQYGIIHIITWKKPSKTLCSLFLYTSICVWPHLVLAYPLLFVMFGVLIPGYVYRHPMQRPELIKVKKRGQSVWDFLSSSESSVIDDLVSEEFMERFENDDLRPFSSRSSDSSTLVTFSPGNTIEETDVQEGNKDRNKQIKKQKNLLMNMRGLQNATSDLLKTLDKAESFWYDTAGFKDEKLATLIFYGVMVAVSIIIFLGQFIPWRLIFIQSGWGFMIICHPNTKTYLQAIKNSKSQMKPKKSNGDITEDKPPKRIYNGPFERHDIIVDDEPEVRIVEIYELQYKTPTHSNYEFYNYYSQLFDIKDHLRLSGKAPSGVDHLSKVYPPKDWKFEMSYINTWTIDVNPVEFLRDRSLINPLVYDIREEETEGWIYDNSQGVPDLDYLFRRRRLFRKCFRYGRDPRAV